MPTSTPSPYAFEGLDRALHEKARLGILAALLAAGSELRFGELKRQCGLTDGNLSRHLEVLKLSGIVEVWKGFESNRPQTVCRLTGEGRKRLRAYFTLLDRIVATSRPLVARPARTRKLPPGFARV